MLLFGSQPSIAHDFQPESTAVLIYFHQDCGDQVRPAKAQRMLNRPSNALSTTSRSAIRAVDRGFERP